MDTCGLERVERFRINLNEKNFAPQKNTLTSSLPQRYRAVGTYGSGNDTLVNVSHVRAAAKRASNSGGTGRSRLLDNVKVRDQVSHPLRRDSGRSSNLNRHLSPSVKTSRLSGLTSDRQASSFHFAVINSRTRVSATTRSWNFGSRTSAEPSIGWPFSS
jgi:hypothetical protein